MLDMRGNVVAVIIVVMAGPAFVRFFKPPSSNTTPRRWIPVVALISGPMLTFAWCIVDACYLSPRSYTQPGDFAETAVPMVFIGLVAGVIGAAGFWIAER